ncbi:PulJ/GspJ family protein [Methylobacterium oxalidis]|uniref:PulJ/GspJ family protein n=1 Tax=Methylobacterium oxalidis TaxID=944322 RepID=UPI003314518E
MAETRQSGFTLVEMLVSLALMALIAVLLVQALQATGIVAARAARIGAQEDVQVVREHLRRMLSEPAARRGDGTRAPFLGAPDRMVAVIAGNREAERGAELRVALALRPRADAGFDLVETRGLAYGSEVPGEPELLLDRVAGLRLQFFGAADAAGQQRWQAGWARRDRNPALVEITVDFPPRDRRRWPPLVVPVGAGS